MRPPLSHFTSCPSACQTARMVSPHSAEAWLRRCSTALPVVSGPQVWWSSRHEILQIQTAPLHRHWSSSWSDNNAKKLIQKLKIIVMIIMVIVLIVIVNVSRIIVIRATIIIMIVQNNSLNITPTQTSTNRSWCAIDKSHDLLSLGPQQGVQWQSPSPVGSVSWVCCGQRLPLRWHLNGPSQKQGLVRKGSIKWRVTQDKMTKLRNWQLLAKESKII